MSVLFLHSSSLFLLPSLSINRSVVGQKSRMKRFWSEEMKTGTLCPTWILCLRYNLEVRYYRITVVLSFLLFLQICSGVCSILGWDRLGFWIQDGQIFSRTAVLHSNLRSYWIGATHRNSIEGQLGKRLEKTERMSSIQIGSVEDSSVDLLLLWNKK